MLLEIYIVFQVLVFILFFTAFISKQELVWVLTLVFAGILMISSQTIEISSYVYNPATTIYELSTTLFYYPYLMGINMIIFVLSLIYFMFDIFDKHGNVLGKKTK